MIWNTCECLYEGLNCVHSALTDRLLRYYLLRTCKGGLDSILSLSLSLLNQFIISFIVFIVHFLNSFNLSTINVYSNKTKADFRAQFSLMFYVCDFSSSIFFLFFFFSCCSTNLLSIPSIICYCCYLFILYLCYFKCGN